MKIKTSELKGAALDYAVSLTQGFKYGTARKCLDRWHFPLSRPDWTTLGVAVLDSTGEWAANVPEYSTDWSQGGPLIESFGGWGISIMRRRITWQDRNYCFAQLGPEEPENKTLQSGETALIAACRAIVMAKLGEEVEIPDELAEAV